MLPHARSQTFGNACPRSCFDCQCTLFTKGNRRISFKKGSAKNYRFQKTQVPLPLVKDTGGMAKLSKMCSILFSDGCPRVATNNEKRKKRFCQHRCDITFMQSTNFFKSGLKLSPLFPSMLDKSLKLFLSYHFTIFSHPPNPQFNDETPHPRFNDESPLCLCLIIEPGVRGFRRAKKKVSNFCPRLSV